MQFEMQSNKTNQLLGINQKQILSLIHKLYSKLHQETSIKTVMKLTVHIYILYIRQNLKTLRKFSTVITNKS